MYKTPPKMAPGRCYRQIDDKYSFESPWFSNQFFAKPNRLHLVMAYYPLNFVVATTYLDELQEQNLYPQCEIRLLKWSGWEWMIFSFESHHEELMRWNALEHDRVVTPYLKQFGDKDFPFVRPNFRFLWSVYTLKWDTWQ
jgi:hypothetical protein